MLPPVKHIGVVIPTHNEQEHISDCVTAVVRSRDFLHHFLTKNNLSKIQVTIIIVLDSCSDGTQAIVENLAKTYPDLHILTCEFRCVGKVRALGVRHAVEQLTQGADWIACTDADSQVNEDWLVAQIKHLQDEAIKNQACDMICGVVSVDSWTHLSPATQEKYLAHYQDRMNHRHIHGANLCFSVKGYEKVGGFADLPCHEDVDLVKKFEDNGLAIVWSNTVRVTTSSRLEARASEGFANFLSNLQKESMEIFS